MQLFKLSYQRSYVNPGFLLGDCLFHDLPVTRQPNPGGRVVALGPNDITVRYGYGLAERSYTYQKATNFLVGRYPDPFFICPICGNTILCASAPATVTWQLLDNRDGHLIPTEGEVDYDPTHAHYACAHGHILPNVSSPEELIAYANEHRRIFGEKMLATQETS